MRRRIGRKFLGRQPLFPGWNAPTNGGRFTKPVELAVRRRALRRNFSMILANPRIGRKGRPTLLRWSGDYPSREGPAYGLALVAKAFEDGSSAMPIPGGILTPTVRRRIEGMTTWVILSRHPF